MAVGLLSLLTSTFLGWIQLRKRRQGFPSEELASTDGRGHKAFNRLKSHIGRVRSLPPMSAADALALGVHPAIDLRSLAPRPGESMVAVAAAVDQAKKKGTTRQHIEAYPELPLFVPREKFQAACHALLEFKADGGFLLLVGNSSVGKTRLLYEASRMMLPDFTLLAPDLGDGELINAIADADFDLPPMIIWLDELQRFLEGPYLTAGHTPIAATAIRKLLEAPSPVVIVSTLWPEYARQLRSTEFDATHGFHRPRYPSALDVLESRRLTEISLDSFTLAERGEAARLAVADPRLLLALENPDYNVTEALSGALEIVRRYERGTKEQRAIVDAAVDARRLGIQGPLSAKLLLDASRAYLPGHYPDDSWFLVNLDDLTSAARPQDRATAPINAITSPDRRTMLGYSVTDFLLQRLSRQRAGQAVPRLAWEALTANIAGPYDQMRLADSAYEKGMAFHAESLYRKLTDAGTDNWQAARKLSLLLAAHGQIDELSTRADNGNIFAAEVLIGTLVSENRIDDALAKLRLYAQSGGIYELRRLAVFLDLCGRRHEARAVLRGLVSRGDGYAERRLLELLVSDGQTDEAAEIVDQGNNWSWLGAYGLAHLKSTPDG
ncbi:hypothetical protein AB0B97_10010 [Micromonospora sp. NPDC049004]|uniref:hypothetical protein n=1 Tax=Micromonospora sp. NPDC049004 TaxID=3154348 RepID=UPI0033F54EA4